MTIGEIKRDEEVQEPERTSGINWVVGGSNADQRDVLKARQDNFENVGLYEGEREKTPEEKEIIEGILKFLPDFVRRYGGNPIALNLNKVHLFPKKAAPEDLKDGNASGMYRQIDQEVILNADRCKNKLLFARVVVHEMLHFNAYQSLTIKSVENSPGAKQINVEPRRQGFSIGLKNVSERLFSDLDEAITGELTTRFDEECFSSIPCLSEFIEERRQQREKMIIDDGISEEESKRLVTASEVKKIFIVFSRRLTYSSYLKEVEQFNDIINKIQQKFPEQFSTQEQVFDVFASAYFSGRLLPVARLIEKTFGSGSFRKIGEETKKVNK